MARDYILHRVRTALGRSPRSPYRIRRPPASASRRSRSMPDGFAAAAVEELAGTAVETSDPRTYIAAAMAGKSAIASNSPYLAACGITGLPGVESGITDREQLRHACATPISESPAPITPWPTPELWCCSRARRKRA